VTNAANDALTTVESAGPLRAAQGTIMGAELSYWRDAMREARDALCASTRQATDLLDAAHATEAAAS
jgi:hypothetical protein